jgi:hypothetical protein
MKVITGNPYVDGAIIITAILALAYVLTRGE